MYCHNAMCYYTRRSFLLDRCYTQRTKICSVMWRAVQYSQHPTFITVLSSICFILNSFCNIDMTYSNEIFYVLFLRLHLYDTCSFKSSLLRDKESETQRWGWWRGCGGGRLTREERMTATIIKNVLLLRYLEASLPFQLLLSNNSLVTSLHCQTPRLLTKLWHWQKEKKERDSVLWTIQFDSFNLAEFNSSIHFLSVLTFIQGHW